MSGRVARSEGPTGTEPRTVGRPVELVRVRRVAFRSVVVPPNISGETTLPSGWDPCRSKQGRDGEVLRIEEVWRLG